MIANLQRVCFVLLLIGLVYINVQGFRSRMALLNERFPPTPVVHYDTLVTGAANIFTASPMDSCSAAFYYQYGDSLYSRYPGTQYQIRIKP